MSYFVGFTTEEHAGSTSYTSQIFINLELVESVRETKNGALFVMRSGTRWTIVAPREELRRRLAVIDTISPQGNPLAGRSPATSSTSSTR